MEQENEEFDEYLAECVAIQPGNDLDGDFRRVSADLAYWAGQHGKAEERYNFAKITLKKVEAEIMEIASKLPEMGAKPAEWKVKMKAAQDSEVYDAGKEYAEACGDKKRVEGILDAIKAKRDMLIQMGADLRKEREIELRLKKEY